MKKKMLFIIIGLFMLVLLASCSPKCDECKRIVETVVVTEIPDEPDLELLSVERENLPPNTLEVFYSTRSDENGQPKADPYMANELILIGSSDQLNDLLKLPELDGFRILSPDSIENSNGFKLISTGDVRVEDAITLINSIKINRGGFSDISAGKNYLTASPWDVEASPWDVEASPWDVEASGEGSGDNFVLKYSHNPNSNDFVLHDIPWQQWAFQRGGPEAPAEESYVNPWGINLFNGGNPTISTKRIGDEEFVLETGVRTVGETGNGIRVIIYDTSPFSVTDTKMITPSGFSSPIQVSVAKTVLPDITNTEMYTDTVEHGLFVAGLVHFVAPGAKIELVQILNNQGVGELYTLINELQKLLKDSDDDPMTFPDLSNVVINLSLGFHPEVQNGTLDNDFYSDPVIVAFKTQLENVQKAGAVIVAAAGNHSSFSYPDNSSQEILDKGSEIITEGDIGIMNSAFPARWAETISVSGEGLRVPSCFSNQVPEESRRIWAPSGGGRQDEIRETTPDGKIIVPVCKSPREECRKTPLVGQESENIDYNCPYAIVSITTKGYRQWSGTSFATSIVSGIVALIMEKCNDASEEAKMDQYEIQEFIYRQYKEPNDHDRLEVPILIERACES